MIVQACQHVGEPGLWVDVVELGGLCRPSNYAERSDFPHNSSGCRCTRLGMVLFLPPPPTAEEKTWSPEKILNKTRLSRCLKKGPHGWNADRYPSRLAKA